MKKLSLFVLVLFMLSCADNSKIQVKNLDCTVIDTVYTAKNGFNTILDYTVIIKIDSSYYGAIQNTNGSISEITGKLKRIKSK